MATPEIPDHPLVDLAKVKILGSQDTLKRLQTAVDFLTRKAKTGGKFTEEEKTFLVRLFESFSWGGFVKHYPEASKLADHYVHGNGKLLKLDEDVYIGSTIVRDVQAVMKRQIQLDLKESRGSGISLASADGRLFRRKDYLALLDKSRNKNSQGRVLIGGWLLTEQDNQRLQKANNRFRLDSVSQMSDGRISTTWRVDDDYVFEPLSKGYYTDITLGEKMALRMPDGLSQYMTTLGIAKSFKHYAEWREIWNPEPPGEPAPTKTPTAKGASHAASHATH